MTLTPSAERLEVELSIPVFTTYVCSGWDSNTQFSARSERSNRLRHRGDLFDCLCVLFANVSFCSCIFCCLLVFVWFFFFWLFFSV